MKRENLIVTLDLIKAVRSVEEMRPLIYSIVYAATWAEKRVPEMFKNGTGTGDQIIIASKVLINTLEYARFSYFDAIRVYNAETDEFVYPAKENLTTLRCVQHQIFDLETHADNVQVQFKDYKTGNYIRLTPEEVEEVNKRGL